MAPLRRAGAAERPCDAEEDCLQRRRTHRRDRHRGVGSGAVRRLAARPRTFVVELRDVVATGFADEFTADPRHPIAAVGGERPRASDGTVVARVRMTLDAADAAARAQLHATSSTWRQRPRSTPLADRAARVDRCSMTRRRHRRQRARSVATSAIFAQRGGNATAVTLQGTARLIATSIEEPKDGAAPARDRLPERHVGVAETTTSVRARSSACASASIPSAPLVTQVTIDLSRAAPYRVESSPDGNDLTVVFDEPPPIRSAALQIAGCGSGPWLGCAARLPRAVGCRRPSARTLHPGSAERTGAAPVPS